MVQKIIQFANDNDLKQELLTLLRPSYIDPTTLLYREVENNDTIYIIRDENHQLEAFFMTGDDSFDDVKLTYLGLSAVKHEIKNSGIGKQLYLAQIEDSLFLQDRSQKKTYCWATTASPSVFLSIHHLWASASPDINFNFSNLAFEIAKAICKKHNYAFADNNPFILKGIAKNTRYSLAEKERIIQFDHSKDFTLFADHNITEENGDRLLLVFELPSWQQFNSLRNL
jgi:hypothetical protein